MLCEIWDTRKDGDVLLGTVEAASAAEAIRRAWEVGITKAAGVLALPITGGMYGPGYQPGNDHRQTHQGC